MSSTRIYQNEIFCPQIGKVCRIFVCLNNGLSMLSTFVNTCPLIPPLISSYEDYL